MCLFVEKSLERILVLESRVEKGLDIDSRVGLVAVGKYLIVSAQAAFAPVGLRTECRGGGEQQFLADILY